ncbi:nitrophenyl compound nitroreductase subunit ArsF family protein [Aeoliella sp. ICT_H6.2]|uniref:Nitrophenyl compound nitroreductase subunit ArsF family protein n=1 Tax=Aeoliella straminimaris TaxID=2954799 RepID=A0A9X2JGU2_9BACT|nr:nitrophenyl compound nitroreductase subunit ArsF family protein [Aeoliella straminimaris]MCO6043933.1 nitrophenyl compound nitroreductase subunit ArsF family protein [Aeoliella straminimaris]
MTTATIISAVLVLSSVVATPNSAPETERPQPADHQVVAIYFHRTQRCPTCKRIGTLSQEAVTKGFAKEAKSGVVDFQLVDFQNKKNTKLAETYGIQSPTLVLLNRFEGETVCWTKMPKVWQLVGKPAAFRAYVQEGVALYLKQTRKDAEKSAEKKQ